MSASCRLTKNEQKVAEEWATTADKLAFGEATVQMYNNQRRRRSKGSEGPVGDGADGAGSADGDGGNAAVPSRPRLPTVPPSWPGQAESHTNEASLADVATSTMVIRNNKIFDDIMRQDPLPIKGATSCAKSCIYHPEQGGACATRVHLLKKLLAAERAIECHTKRAAVAGACG